MPKYAAESRVILYYRFFFTILVCLMTHGLLLINLGTPEAPDTASVRSYLCEFLSDSRVIDLPAPLRYLILYLFILPFRPRQSAHAYQAIWTKAGSPLLVNSEQLIKKLQQKLGEHYRVALSMRYGKPSLSEGLKQLEDCEQLTILPLYPQYSSAASGSSIEKALTLLAKKNVQPTLTIIRDFYQHPGFIKPQAALIRPYLQDHDFLLLSFHGLPERHLKAAGCTLACQASCPPTDQSNEACYRAQCFATSRQLAQHLDLREEQYAIAFQSRLGKTPWIKPYTDEILPELAARGIKRLAVACPAFVADCLETLEEIGIRAKQQWQELGGEELTLVPCVNDDDSWVHGLIDICGFANPK